MSKLTFFADFHLKRETLPVCVRVLDELAERCRQDKTDLGFGGDFFDKRNDLPVEFYAMLAEKIETWEFKSFWNVGNHDQYNIEGRNALEVLGAFPNVTVMTVPQWTEHGLWVPYRYKHDDLHEALKIRKPKGSAPVVFMHHGLSGAMMNNFKMNSEGITADDVPKKFNKIFLGHYHKFQDMGRAVYVGSPYQTNWSEIGQPKGFLQIDGADYDFVEWDIGPTHHRIEWNGKGKPKTPAGFREGYDYARVVTTMNQDDAGKNKVHDKLNAAGLGAAIVEFQPKVRNEERATMTPGKSRRDQVKEYLDNCELPESIDKATAFQTLFELVEV